MSALQPGDVVGMDKQAVADGEYAAAYYAGDPPDELNDPIPGHLRRPQCADPQRGGASTRT